MSQPRNKLQKVVNWRHSGANNDVKYDYLFTNTHRLH